MNREIKFRIWSIKENKFWENDTDFMIFLNGKHIYHWNQDSRGDICDELKREEYELNQFTGLKDKNGKDIYEGDILMDEWKGNKRYNPVKYESNGFEHDDEGIGFGIEHNKERQQTDRYEVVGNVYENPELLK